MLFESEVQMSPEVVAKCRRFKLKIHSMMHVKYLDEFNITEAVYQGRNPTRRLNDRIIPVSGPFLALV